MVNFMKNLKQLIQKILLRLSDLLLGLAFKVIHITVNIDEAYFEILLENKEKINE